MDTYTIDPTSVRDVGPEVLDNNGRMRVLPAEYWASTTTDERLLFGHRHGIYGFPTTELVGYLRALVGQRTAIEIGAGNGALAQAMGIPATDNRIQEKDPHRLIFALTRQPTVRYGPNVIDCEASQAVRQFTPDVVIGCWVMHRYDDARPQAGGLAGGVDEIDVLNNCQMYVLIGNERVHRDTPLWGLPHTIEYPPFVFSRAANGSRDFVATWPGGTASRQTPA